MRITVNDKTYDISPHADLRWANLRGEDLRGVNLRGADLRGANLRGASLQEASLQEASLQRASLGWADLRGADLRGANLQRANLRGADLRGASLPSPTMLLLASWGELSSEVTKRAMAYDASCHHNPDAFVEWFEDPNFCPYNGCRYERACNFIEDPAHAWEGEMPLVRPWDLMVEILREKCADSDWHA